MRWDVWEGVEGSGHRGIRTSENRNREHRGVGDPGRSENEAKRDNGDREPGDVRIGISKEGEWKMATPRDSGNRGIGNQVLNGASLVNPLIPFARISEIGQKHSHHSGLPCVIFLKVAG